MSENIIVLLNEAIFLFFLDSVAVSLPLIFISYRLIFSIFFFTIFHK